MNKIFFSEFANTDFLTVHLFVLELSVDYIVVM